MMSEKYEKRNTVMRILVRETSKTRGCQMCFLALFAGICFVLSGCVRQLTPFGKARQADTVEAYEEFIRTCPNDPRVIYARDRIEVLKLIEAHRSGDASLAAPEKGAFQQRVVAPAEPTNVRQGPWNLSGALPRSSRFTLDLYHGDPTPIPHKLIIDQQGQQVNYTLQHGSGPEGYYLKAGVPFNSFRRLWQAVMISDIGLYKPSYGRMSSTSDYRGNLIIEVDTGTERLSRIIRLEGVSYEDANLRNLIRSMTQMHPQDQSMYFFQ